MCSSIPGAFTLLPADARQGMKVHYRRAQWHHRQRHGVTCIAVFHTGALRRIVYEHRSLPFYVVAAKFIAQRSDKVLDHDGEVGHAY